MRTLGSIVMAGGVFSVVCGLSSGTAEEGTPTPGKSSAASATDKPGESDVPRVSLETARDRAKLMHEVYAATLTAMHHRYFHGDRATVPARAMEDVFMTMERKSKSQARWISASLSPMSINHEPKTNFEKQAAQKLAAGEDGIEVIEDGYYRRAGSIPMSGGCVSCHAGLFASTSTGAKFSGLVISIPVQPNEQLTSTTTPAK